MGRFTIYLVGKMSGLSFEEYNEWRDFLSYEMKYLIDHNGKTVQLDIINPAELYNYETKMHQTEREIMEYELAQIRNADLVIANLDGINTSVGSIVELMIARENKVPIIGFLDCDSNLEDIHPWIREVLLRVERSYHRLIEYVDTYFIR